MLRSGEVEPKGRPDDRSLALSLHRDASNAHAIIEPEYACVVVLCNIVIAMGKLDFHNLMDRLPNALGVAKSATETPYLVTVREDVPFDGDDPRSSAVAVQAYAAISG